MKKNLLKYIFPILIIIATGQLHGQGLGMPRANDYTIALTREFAKAIFDSNGTAYLQPLVVSMIATSNSRFFNQAYVPAKVDKPYFRVSLNNMIGLVKASQKSFAPVFPHEPLDINKLSQYVKFGVVNGSLQVTGIPDTAALIFYALKVYLDRGIQTGTITPPTSSATILGCEEGILFFPKAQMNELVKTYPEISPGVSLYDLLPDSLKSLLTTTINQFPDRFALPAGANLSTLYAFVPQIEIGSLWGTEMLLRLIPPVDLGSNIGKFAFWGLGLKHSISQYFDNPPLDLAVQVVGQGTNLKNKIGVTNSELVANGDIWDINLQASKSFYDNSLTIYSGLSQEWLIINSSYKYYLPIDTQAKLGLVDYEIIGYDANNDPILKALPPTPPRYPGDTLPQTSNIVLRESNFKFIIGLTAKFGPFGMFVDYNISKFNIFTGGLSFTF